MNKKAMRVVFGETLREIGNTYPTMVVLDADVSKSTQTKLFQDYFPDRFYNFGIAEANMVSAAAGMAVCGLIPIVSSFAFLLALRTGDSVRSLIAYNKLNVKIAGGYAGLSDYADGASHQSVMDIAIMRSMPNMTVIVPSDIESTKMAVKQMVDFKGPIYIRLSRHEVGSLHKADYKHEIGKAYKLREGSDVTIVVTGPLLGNVIEASDNLAKKGIQAEILEYSTIKPFDVKTLIESAQKTKLIITVEEHNVIGGLGSAVSECLEGKCGFELKRLGIDDCFGESGSYEELLKKFGLDSDSIEIKVRELVLQRKLQ